MLDLTSEVRKDNTGIDLKQLFIGAEGALGVITRVNTLASALDEKRSVLLLKLRDFGALVECTRLARSVLGRNLAALEWLDEVAFETTLRAFRKANPFAGEGAASERRHYLLVELAQSSAEQDLQLLFAERVSELAADCVISQNAQQYEELWSIREFVGPAAKQLSKAQFKYDVSVDIRRMEEITAAVRNRLAHLDVFVQGYSHIGDSDLHINVGLRDERDYLEAENLLEPFVYQIIRHFRGSISAEHGIGQMKSAYLGYQKSDLQIQYMKLLKSVFDPANILNPFKIVPQ